MQDKGESTPTGDAQDDGQAAADLASTPASIPPVPGQSGGAGREAAGSSGSTEAEDSGGQEAPAAGKPEPGTQAQPETAVPAESSGAGAHPSRSGVEAEAPAASAASPGEDAEPAATATEAGADEPTPPLAPAPADTTVVPAAAPPTDPQKKGEGAGVEEVDMGKLLAGTAAPSTSQVKVGDRISGVLVRVGQDNSFVDFGGRCEGILSSSELIGEDGELAFAVGEPLEAFVVATGDEVRLSRFLRGEDREADMLYKAFKAETPVEGRVMAVNKWGLGVELAGTRAFCPISQIDTHFVQNPEEYRDKTLQFKIIRFRDRGRSIVLSRRALLEVEQEKQATVVRSQIAVDAILTGKVTRLESFGAFVDLGHGVEGLVHVSEFKHERVGHPQEVVEPGQEVRVKVLEIKSLGSRRKERISLSMKALEADPWGEVRSRFPQGSVVTGKVGSIESYGAFVELAENVRGLVHVSEMANRRVNHPRDVVSVGDEVKVAIIELDNRRKRLRLSMRRAEQMEGEANLKEFSDRQKREQEEAGSSSSAMLEALKRAQLID